MKYRKRAVCTTLLVLWAACNVQHSMRSANHRAREKTSLAHTGRILGSRGGSHSFSWPGPWLPLLSHLPLLLTRSSCRGMPARSSTSAFAVSNTSPEMVSKRKSPHELERVPRKKKKKSEHIRNVHRTLITKSLKLQTVTPIPLP